MSNFSCFKNTNVSHVFTISTAKPAVRQIIKDKFGVIIDNKKIIETRIARSEEGYILTGKKLIVEGKVICQIEYAADIPQNNLYAIYYEIPFSTNIILSEEIDNDRLLIIKPYTEDTFCQIIDDKNIYIGVTLLIVAEY